MSWTRWRNGIDGEVAVDLARPDDIASPELNESRRLLLLRLHSHDGDKAA